LSSNRISILGSVVAAFGFFFLPIIEIKPNRLASGMPVNLLELTGDYRYVALFILALVPFIVAFQQHQGRRGWSLVAVGNLVLFLTLVLPATAGADLLAQADTLFGEGVNVSNPRVLTSGAIAFGLLGGYIILFGGLLDLREVGVPTGVRLGFGMAGLALIIYQIINGGLDIYSVMVEFESRGDGLRIAILEHFVFVLIALIAGLVLGIALGLWAARDARIENPILYTVGIIQTIPSLALFGVLLVPLARLGNQGIIGTFQTFGISAVIAAVVFGAYLAFQRAIPENLRAPALVISVLALFVPVALFTTVFIVFTFESVLTALNSETLASPLTATFFAYLSVIALVYIERQLKRPRRKQVVRYIQIGAILLATLSLLVILFLAGQEVLDVSLAEATVRDLGVSGIGTAPALIALTLYSLLPLVRNTYAGLNNIDPAIIDSGKGMGMTASQIFFKIELPLAFPIIMAGVRNAGISLVGITAVASIIGAGALGDFILPGINGTSIDLILLGALPAVVLAIALDALLQAMEAFFTSPGLKQVSN
jgi:ABC-type proline/glycine betaine transport system permease subunit